MTSVPGAPAVRRLASSRNNPRHPAVGDVYPLHVAVANLHPSLMLSRGRGVAPGVAARAPISLSFVARHRSDQCASQVDRTAGSIASLRFSSLPSGSLESTDRPQTLLFLTGMDGAQHAPVGESSTTEPMIGSNAPRQTYEDIGARESHAGVQNRGRMGVRFEESRRAKPVGVDDSDRSPRAPPSLLSP